MVSQCKICGKPDCHEHVLSLGKPIKIDQFSGSSPPEIFVGRWNYPNVYTGILSPENKFGNNQIMSSPELWHKNKVPISNILNFRNQLIYGRSQSNIKKLQTRFLSVLHEVAMTHKSIATEFKLKKPVKKNTETEKRVPLIPKAAPVKSVSLQENTKIKPKVDYLVNDTDAKSVIAVQELNKVKIPTSSIIKIFSAGLLGLKKNRRLVPTRWSISSVDSILSENKIKKIKKFSQINDYLVFSGEYVGNHYEILLMPRYWSYEIIEASWTKGLKFWQDYETFFKRKKYASDVTGGYYSPRVAVSEYLEKNKKQASVLIFRESRPEYYAPLGVGILRETTRSAMKKTPNKFGTLQESLKDMQTRLHLPINRFIQRSQLLKDLQQTTLSQFI
jgi:DNA repair protein NreA